MHERERKRKMWYIVNDAIIAHWSQIQSRTKTEYISKVKSNCDEVKLTRTSSSFTSVESRLPLQCRCSSALLRLCSNALDTSSSPLVSSNAHCRFLSPARQAIMVFLFSLPLPLPPLPEQRGRGKRLNRYITSYLTVDTVTRPSAS